MGVRSINIVVKEFKETRDGKEADKTLSQETTSSYNSLSEQIQIPRNQTGVQKMKLEREKRAGFMEKDTTHLRRPEHQCMEQDYPRR